MLFMGIRADPNVAVDWGGLRNTGLLPWHRILPSSLYLDRRGYKRHLLDVIMNEDDHYLPFSMATGFLRGGPNELLLFKLALPTHFTINLALHLPKGKKKLKRASHVIKLNKIIQPNDRFILSPCVMTARLKKYREWAENSPPTVQLI